MTRRQRAERRFRRLALAAVLLSAGLVLALLASVVLRGGAGLSLRFFTGADSIDPGRVGIWGGLKGSLLTIRVTLGVACPLGGAVALYLEEFADRSRWSTALELLINNLAAVPTILFGLLGLAVFLGGLGLPRSAPLVAGLTLALMTAPVIVIAGRAALRAVPPSVREAAQGLGASRAQVAFHHVLPLALPGMLTGALLGAARALGETAPLLLIGMRAFIAAPPRGLTSPATVLPMQIFLWADEVAPRFVDRTAAAMLVLLTAVLGTTAAAAWLRRRLERGR